MFNKLPSLISFGNEKNKDFKEVEGENNVNTEVSLALKLSTANYKLCVKGIIPTYIWVSLPCCQ
jgi:hypothetical protein